MQAFPVKVLALWRQVFPGAMAGAAINRVLKWAQGEPFALPPTLTVMAISGVSVAVIYFLQPTLVGASGLRVMTIWGFRRQIAWPDVRSARHARMYGLYPSIRLEDDRRRSYWIGRDTRRLAELHALACRHGGKGHPLVQALETPLHAL